jgi:uncharacterized protein
MSEQRYNRFGSWLRRRFGTRVHKVSVDGGFTCPNRDGTLGWGGCTYCSNDSFRAYGADAARPMEEQIRNGIDFLARRYRAEKFLVYWQNHTNTYAPVGYLEDRFRRSLSVDSRIAGMTIGTRPDCIEEEKLAMIERVAAGRYVCVEYGLESVFDETLRRVNRGHDFACFQDAVRRTRNRGFDVCTHVILGFPGESRDQWLSYADALNNLAVDFVKIHHLHVVKGTPLAKEYLHRPFPVFSLDDWVTFVCDFLERLRPSIVIQRLFGWAPEAFVIAPRWNVERSRALQAILSELERRDSRQGKRVAAAGAGVRPMASAGGAS